MTLSSDDVRLITREAARWAMRQRETESYDARSRAEFAEWVLTSPEHLRHYLIEIAVDDALSFVRPWARAGNDRAETTGAPKRRIVRWAAGRSGFWSAWRIAAAILVVFGLSLAGVCMLWPGDAAPEQDASNIVRPGVMTLADGSAVELRIGSTVEVSFTRSGRDVHLSGGGAIFDVVKNAAWPFRVHVGEMVITAKGTRFEVRLADAAGKPAEVLVREGTVAITSKSEPLKSTDIVAGQVAQVTAAGRVERVQPLGQPEQGVELANAALFSSKTSTLAEIAGAFNLQGKAPRLNVQGLACEKRPSVRFKLDDPQRFVDVLNEYKEFTVVREGDVVIVRMRDEVIQAGTETSDACRAASPISE